MKTKTFRSWKAFSNWKPGEGFILDSQSSGTDENGWYVTIKYHFEN